MCNQGSSELKQWRLGKGAIEVAGNSTVDPLQHHPCSLPYISTVCQPGLKAMAYCSDQHVVDCQVYLSCPGWITISKSKFTW